jgi:hypothetical protein
LIDFDVLDGTIACGEGRQPDAAGMLIDVVTGEITLGLVEGVTHRCLVANAARLAIDESFAASSSGLPSGWRL